MQLLNKMTFEGLCIISSRLPLVNNSITEPLYVIAMEVLSSFCQNMPQDENSSLAVRVDLENSVKHWPDYEEKKYLMKRLSQND